MEKISLIFESYLTTLVHPFRIHEQFRSKIPMNGYEGELIEPLSLAEAIGASWIFAFIRGICKIVILNFFLQTILAFQSDNFPVLQEIAKSSGISTYYFLLFSAALDVIFFPIGAIIMTEVWSWVIKSYTKFLNPELPRDEIAEEITHHALTSNLFSVVPFLGDVLQPLIYYFLLYAGLRSNLGASRSLAWVILLTPTILGAMAISLLVFVIFYLAT
jgi:hypothetical protein